LKFREFEEEVNTLRERTRELLIDEELLSETFNVKDKRVRIFLGDRIKISIDGDTDNSFYDLKSYYTSKDKIWEEVLGAFKTKIAMAEVIHGKLIAELIRPYLKETVLDRLTGTSEDIPSNEEILKKAVERRKNKLNSILPIVSKTKIVWDLPSPSKNFRLSAIVGYSGPYIIYGDGGIKSNWSFLCNYPQIEATVQQFNSLLKPLLEFCK
jgi:hypothetical protein